MPENDNIIARCSGGIIESKRELRAKELIISFFRMTIIIRTEYIFHLLGHVLRDRSSNVPKISFGRRFNNCYLQVI